MGGPIEQHLLPLKISWKNWGGATRRRSCLLISQKRSCWIHLGWEMGTPPGRTSSQTKYGNKQGDCPETTWKLTPLPLNLRLWATWQSSSPALWVHLPSKFFCFVRMGFPWTIHFRVLDKCPLSDLERVPHTYTDMLLHCSSLWAQWRKCSPLWKEGPSSTHCPLSKPSCCRQDCLLPSLSYIVNVPSQP